MKIKIIYTLFLLFFFPVLVKAFPETARHGYLSCATCHLSPSGRGILTSYGKSLSYELYSYKKVVNDRESLESEAPWWQIGGRVRVMQLIEDTTILQKGHFFPMQNELEASVDKEKLAVGLSLGLWRPIEDPSAQYKTYVRNAYLLWRLSDIWNLRLGKFRISHGLGLPDHATLVNEFLGWTHSHETQNFEVSHSSDDLIVQGNWILPSELLVTKEKISGLSFSVEKLFNLKQKVGLNLSRFRRSHYNDTQINVHSVLSLNEKTFIQLEIAQRRTDELSSESQWAHWSRLSREINYGFKPFVQWEEAQSNNHFSNTKSSAQRFFVGTEWFPIVHTDFLFMMGTQKETGLEEVRLLSLIGHFYF